MNLRLHGWATPQRCGAVALICLTLLTGCQPESTTTKTDTPTALELNRADLVRATEQNLSASTRITGSLQALRQSSVHPQTTAMVQSVTVNNGDSVQRGQVLIVLNDQDNRSRLAQAQANLAQARAQQILSNSLRDRNLQLYRQGFISEIELERSKADAAAQQEQVNAQRALLQITEKSLQDSVLKAPISGIISARNVEVGQTVAAGQSLLSIVDPDSLELQASVNADAQASLRLGQPITFQVQGMPEKSFQATIRRIAPLADPSNRSLTVYASVDAPDPQLRAGVFVDGILRYGTVQRGVVLPKTSIQPADASNTSDYVWVIVDNRIQKQPITIQSVDPVSELALVQGLSADSQVVRIALAQGAEGRAVKIAP